jgi:prolyl oligopeptidase
VSCGVPCCAVLCCAVLCAATTAVVYAITLCRDGTRIPVFYVGARQREGEVSPRPTLLYGYGGFSISLCPSFSSTRLVWLQELGGVYAQAV